MQLDIPGSAPSNKYGWLQHFLSCIKMFNSLILSQSHLVSLVQLSYEDILHQDPRVPAINSHCSTILWRFPSSGSSCTCNQLALFNYLMKISFIRTCTCNQLALFNYLMKISFIRILVYLQSTRTIQLSYEDFLHQDPRVPAINSHYSTILWSSSLLMKISF